MFHDSPYTANFSENSIQFPKVVLIRGIWWSNDYLLYGGMDYIPANNISILGRIWASVSRSVTDVNIEQKNITVKYFSQPILTKSAQLWYDYQSVNFMPNILGYYGNYWVVNNRSRPPFELEMYGCEDYDLEKGKINLMVWFFIIHIKYFKADPIFFINSFQFLI